MALVFQFYTCVQTRCTANSYSVLHFASGSSTLLARAIEALTILAAVDRNIIRFSLIRAGNPGAKFPIVGQGRSVGQMNPCCDMGCFASLLEGVGRVRPGEEEEVTGMHRCEEG